MQPTEFGQHFDANVYNALASVDAADSAVRAQSRLGEFLDAASKIFRSHQMQSRFGVALLHQHHHVAPDEHMIEYAEAYEQSDALITRPVTKTPQAEGAVPSVWAIADGTYVPLEFTTDPMARDLFLEGDVPAAFLAEFAALSKASPVGNLLGLAVVGREFYGAAKPNDVPLEYSNLLERSNVVFMKDRSATGKTIETAWSFQSTDDGTGKICVKICHMAGDKHSGQQVHTPQ